MSIEFSTKTALFNAIVNRVEGYRQQVGRGIDRSTGLPFYETSTNAGRAAADRDYLLEIVRSLQRRMTELEKEVKTPPESYDSSGIGIGLRDWND